MTLTQITTAIRDITPPVGFPMGGYGVDAPRRATATRRPLTARCTVLWFDGVPHAVVTADVLGFGRSLHGELREHAERRGLTDGRYVLTATHTHSGPVLPQKLDPFASYAMVELDGVTRYAHTLLGELTGVLDDALAADPEPVTVRFHRSTARFSYNRESLPHDETEVPVLTARRSDGSVRALLLGYGAHPVAAGIQTQWDTDYPGEAIAALEAAHSGVHAQFLLGPAGDQNPRQKGSFGIVAQYGADLAAAVTAALETPGITLTAAPAVRMEWVRLPFDAPERATAAAEYRARAADVTAPGYKRRHAKTMAATAVWPEEELLPVQAWLFPELAVVFCGGEVVSGFAEHARAHSARPVWFAGYANEVPGYIPTDDLLDHPCYAGSRDADHPQIAGGSGTVYGFPAPFRSSPDGVQERVFAALERVISAPAPS